MVRFLKRYSDVFNLVHLSDLNIAFL